MLSLRQVRGYMQVASPGMVRNPDSYPGALILVCRGPTRKSNYFAFIHIIPGKLLYLQHILFRQTKIAVAADDQVVVDRQVEGLPGLYQGLGQFLVGDGGF